MPHADNGKAEVLIEAEDAADALFELCNIIADPLFAELPEGSEVLADLFGIDRKAPSKLLGRDDIAAFVTELAQAAVITRQTVDRRLRYR